MKSTLPILLVDDDPSYRTMLRYRLEALGYQVLEAEDGDQGYRIASGKPLQLVIVDMVMPKSEGLETIARLRCEGVHTKILAISGAGRSPVYLDVAAKLGADAIMDKVRPMSELLGKVQTLAGDVNPLAAD